MKKINPADQPLTHRFSRTFLNGVTGVMLASTLGFGMLGFTGCATDASAAPTTDDSAIEQGAQDAMADEQAAEDTSAKSERSREKNASTDSDAADANDTKTADTTDNASDAATDTDADNSAATADTSTNPTFEAVAADFDVSALDLEYSNRDTDPSYDEATATKVSLSGTGADVTGEGVTVADGLVTITAEGTYVLSGSFDGCVMVDAPDTDKVQLVLDGVTITNDTSAALFVKQADKCFITLADGSENVLKDGAEYTFEEGEDEPNAPLFSKEDLTINGSGKLTVEGNYRHGIVSKDDLVITGGEFDVTSVEDALRGKDCVKIQDGTFTVNAGQDGIKSNNDSDATRGFVSIDGGSFDITAGDEGVQATTYLRIAGGDFIISASDDALHSDLEAVLEDGVLVIEAGDDAFHAETSLTLNGGEVAIRQCVEGYEAEKIYVNDGVHYIVSSDDALNAAVADLSGEDSSSQYSGAEFGGGRMMEDFSGEFDWGEKPARPDMGTEDFGTIDGTPEETTDAEGAMPQRQGKGGRNRFQDTTEVPADPSAENTEAAMTAPEDSAAPEMPEGGYGKGWEAADPAAGGMSGEMPAGRGDFGGRGGMGGPGGMAGSSTDCLLQINGGYLWVDAQGDGLDSNGNLEINGGTVLVNGPSGSGNCALDYEFSADVNGGNVILVGSAGMAEDFSQTSTQPFVATTVDGQSGDTVALVDADGQVLISMTATKTFQMVQASSSALTEGEACSIVVGGTIEGGDEMGFVDSGTVEGGTVISVTASTTPSGAARGMMGGRGGRF